MSNEIIKDELVAGQVELLEKTQLAVDNKIATQAEIAKIISFKSTATILHTEVIDGEIHFSGKLKTQIVFQTSANNYENASMETEWISAIKDSKIKNGNFVCAKATVIDQNITQASQNSISTSNIVEIEAKFITNDKITYTSGSSENIYVLNDGFTSDFLLTTDKQKITLDFEVKNHDKIRQILNENYCIRVKNAKPLNNMVALDGILNYSLLMLCDENELKIVNEDASFSEEILINGVNEESRIDMCLSITQCNAKVEEDKLIITCIAEVCTNVYNSKTLNFVSDAFSTTNELNLKIVSLTQNKYKFSFDFENEVAGSVLVGGEGYEIRKVVGAFLNHINLAQVSYEGGEIIIEGIANFTCVYVGVEDDINSVEIELPFAVKNRNTLLTENQLFKVCACICDVRARIRKANEIEVIANACFQVKAFENEQYAYVCDIEIGEGKVQQDVGMVVYVAKGGETIFEIAKKLSVKPTLITAQNPNLIEPIGEGEQIIIYNQKINN